MNPHLKELQAVPSDLVGLKMVCHKVFQLSRYYDGVGMRHTAVAFVYASFIGDNNNRLNFGCGVSGERAHASVSCIW